MKLPNPMGVYYIQVFELAVLNFDTKHLLEKELQAKIESQES